MFVKVGKNLRFSNNRQQGNFVCILKLPASVGETFSRQERI